MVTRDIRIRKVAAKLLPLLLTLTLIYLGLGLGFHFKWKSAREACREEG
jgi:hypothetical protein